MLYTINPSMQRKYHRILVAGDLHGDYDSFSALKSHFNPRKDILILLGDYADRGEYGLEIIEELRRWQIRGRENVAMLFGNHELFSDDGKPHFRPCNLVDEADIKRESWQQFFKDTMKPFLDQLYHAAVLPGEILFVHAGVSPSLEGLYSLENPDKQLILDLLWSDPVTGNVSAEHNMMRGEGVVFGERLSRRICSLLGVKKIIRSHQPSLATDGPATMHDGKVVTINSTASYSGKPHLMAIPLDNPDNTETIFLK